MLAAGDAMLGDPSSFGQTKPFLMRPTADDPGVDPDNTDEFADQGPSLGPMRLVGGASFIFIALISAALIGFGYWLCP